MVVWVERRSCLRQAEVGSLFDDMILKFILRPVLQFVHAKSPVRPPVCCTTRKRRSNRRAHVDLGGDTEFESEIEAVVGALEAIEESDAIEAHATWQQTRAAMAQEKLNRGLRTPVHQHSNSTSVIKNVPKPDLAKLAGRTRCYNCREIGHFSRNCPKRRVETPGTDAGVRAVSCELDMMATADVLSARVIFGETCEGGAMETHFVGRERGGRGNQSDAEVLGVCHRPGCAVPDAGCARTLIGQSALRRHVEASGKEPRWLSDVRPVKFRGFDDSTQHSQGQLN